MPNKWEYLLIAFSSFAVGGVSCGSAGLLLGYYKSKPEVYVHDFNNDGDNGLCVAMSSKEALCAEDYNQDGSIDIITVDLEKGEPINIEYGKNPCLVRSVDDLLKEFSPKKSPGQ